MEFTEFRKAICEKGKILWQMGFTASNDGNISIRAAENRILITPTGVSKGNMTPDMIIEVDGEGNVAYAPEGLKPTSEMLMHLRIYHDRPDVMAVVHAHPPVATGFAVAHVPLDDLTMPEAIVSFGTVPLAGFGAPLTTTTQDEVGKLLGEHDAMLIANHGAVTMGPDLETAYRRMETVEQFAKVTLVSRLLGGGKNLTNEELAQCYYAHDKFGIPGAYKKIYNKD